MGREKIGWKKVVPVRLVTQKKYLEVSIDTVTRNKMVMSVCIRMGHRKKQNSDIMKKKQKMLAKQGHP